MVGKPVPPHEWEAYFEQLSLECEGWNAIVEHVGADTTEVLETSEHSLNAIRFEDGAEENQIVVELGDELPISIGSPERVTRWETEQLEDEVLEIEAPTRTLRLHLRFPNV